MVKMERGKGSVTNVQILIDSDAFVSWFIEADYFHTQASRIFENIMQTQTTLAATNWVIAETATVLSYRVGQAQALKFLRHIEDSKLPLVHISEELEQHTRELFQKQTGRGISMVDCSNVAVMQHLGIQEIFSFDKFYKRLGLKTAA
jgi:predicted nucleic acid-binding protein